VSECDIISPLCCPETRATDLGNKSATNLTKKEGLGNKKEKKILTECKQ
jgi:hypothetical protein